MNLTSKQKEQLITYYPELRMYFDIESIKERRTEADGILLALISKIQSLKGDKGDTPIKGKDYFTESEINQWVSYILKESTPVKGVHYTDGEKGDKGDSYILTAEDRKKIARSIDVPVVEKVIEKTTVEVLPEDIARRLNSLKNVLDVSVIRGAVNKKDLESQDKKVLDGMTRIDGRIKLIDQRWHGGGLKTVSHDTTLSGDGTAANPLSVIGTGSGGAFITVTGTIDGNNTVYTTVTRPTMVYTDMGVWAEDSNFGFTWVAGTLTVPIAPNAWVKAN